MTVLRYENPKAIVKKMLVLFIVLLPHILAAQESLHITITNVKNSNGVLQVALFTEDGFLKKPYAGLSIAADVDSVTVDFKDIPPGNYAISVIHDENENKELDTNVIGIPKEGFGFGNDAMGAFGPPSFKNASISWEGVEASFTVRLRYF